MAIYRELNIAGMQNAEMYISKILKEHNGHVLENVSAEGNNLIFRFNEDITIGAKASVKQFSKEKYKVFDKTAFDKPEGFSERIINLPKMWLVFLIKEPQKTKVKKR